jgi:hypothetical protein
MIYERKTTTERRFSVVARTVYVVVEDSHYEQIGGTRGSVFAAGGGGREHCSCATQEDAQRLCDLLADSTR